MFKWELYEEYKKQDEKALELTEKYTTKVKNAKDEVTTSLDAYEDVLKKEFAGENVSTQKKKVLNDIEKAKTALQVAEEEAKQANEYANQELQGKINSINLVDDWLENIEPTIRKTRFEPIVKQAQTALKDYYSALVDFYKLNDEFSGLLSELNELERTRKRKRGDRGSYVYTDIAPLSELPKPTNEDLMYIQQTKSIPDEFKEVI